MLPGIVVEQVGRRLADALPEAFGGLPQLPRFHGEHGLQGVGSPVTVAGVDPGV